MMQVLVGSFGQRVVQRQSRRVYGRGMVTLAPWEQRMVASLKLRAKRGADRDQKVT